MTRRGPRFTWDGCPVGSEAPEADTLPQRVRAEQIDILFRHAPLAQTTNAVVGAVLAGFLWDIVPRATLLAWYAAVAAVVLFRFVLFLGYRRRGADSRVDWAAWMTGSTLGSGLVWGAAGVLFFDPGSALALVSVTIILAGMAAGSIPSHSSWPAAQLSYAIPTMTPIALAYLLQGGELRMLGLLCLIYLANVVLFARQLSRTLVESLWLRLEKQALAQRLSEEKQAAETARGRAEEANLAKSRFLAAASHDLRQPLHAVNLFVEALRHERNPAKTGQIVEHLGASAQALEELLNELLDISKLEAGLFKPQTRVLALGEVFAALERELSPVAEEKGIELGFVPTRLKVRSDPQMLNRILRNIVTNAIRYTERGAVLVGCRRRGGQVAILVCDTGPGIAPEHHQAIFREFYQLGNPERDRRKGLGLGLAIVDGLCRVLGHGIELHSRPGRGSTFTVLAPRATGDDPAGQPPPEETPRDLAGYAVLVIDDEPAIREAMARVLAGWDCDVLTAEDAREAVALLAAEAFRPDAIIADYRLREGRTGTEAIAEVRRALGRDVPAAILTGDTAPERLAEASASGFVLMHKPVQPARLRAVLDSLRRPTP